MKAIWYIIIVTAIAGMAGTGLGGLVGAILRKDSSKVVSLLLSFAAGVMLAVVCFDLLPASFNPEGSETPVSIWLVALGCVAGFGVVYLLNWLIDKNTNPELSHIEQDEHPATADALDELIHSDHFYEHRSRNGNQQLFLAGIVMAFAIALHNMPEGMVIGASFANDVTNISGNSALLVAVIIGLHNIPEGMAVSVPLISGGMSKTMAVMVTALSGLPTILGALVGYSLGLIGPIWLSLSLSFAGGAMLYVVFGELMPEAFLMLRSKAPAVMTLIGVLVGLFLVYM